ncbi:hypothetical protein NBRC10512_001339 [Rhodotorula toruloides]|uniref:U three protein 7 n=2 Tax=Rhodotorula toruloides TaxID=5286 RepID=A0A061BRS4_RHOTO|nr:WD-repeat protein [Rhodotorula toruloides NP11]EMS18212.1 WD-repeat protein [Rhodotorula toruloides NP11]CDR49768.1 RHTO0S32e00452g1_1 [Rhodotorula toruloides]
MASRLDKGTGRADPLHPSPAHHEPLSIAPQDSHVPPSISLQQMKKYQYAQPHMLKAHSKPPKRAKSAFDKKLGHHLAHLSSSAQASASLSASHDDLLLQHNNAGALEAETDLERTWRVTQDEIVDASAVSAESQAFSLQLDQFGPYDLSYTRNGRHLAIAGRLGHVGTFDVSSSSLHSELHLNETTRAITWLHDESFYAVAQKRFVYIYDKQGLEVHQLRSHVEVEVMQFLPYHFLLATIGQPGYLKYQDTSTGQLVAEHRTRLGSCKTMAQNLHTAMIHLGHQNGTVTLWSPSVSHAQVKLLAHKAPVTSVAVDPSMMGHRMATTAADGTVKVWDARMWKCLNEYAVKKTPKASQWSGKGMLAVGWGNHVSVYNDLSRPSSSPRMPPPPYLTHLFPSTPVHALSFQPFTDVLTVGHSRGISSLLVPGSGEANFDSLEADPFEGKRRRREREVQGLLDKVPMDLITLDADVVGRVDRGVLRKGEKKDVLAREGATSFAKMSRAERLKVQGKAALEEDEELSEGEDEDEEDEELSRRREKAEKRIEKADAKNRMRGKSSGLKKALRKRRRNVIDPQTVALKAKLERQRELNKQAKANKAAKEAAQSGQGGALERFKFA